ncbi:hypothetical protein ACIO6U_10755 [Streptomyces sp. NPDC087422]|uniref:hypothetical protein n=1 Tax=Streptomyces sp. NPDC087422 TaxID=3365786 RepID=UPI00381D5DA6
MTSQPDTSTAIAPELTNSTQSPGVPPLDSTSLIFTAEGAASAVGETVGETAGEPAGETAEAAGEDARKKGIAVRNATPRVIDARHLLCKVCKAVGPSSVGTAGNEQGSREASGSPANGGRTAGERQVSLRFHTEHHDLETILVRHQKAQ